MISFTITVNSIFNKAASYTVGDAIIKGVVKANKNNYRKMFIDKYPDLPDGYQVHYTLPQKYESLFYDEGMNIHNVSY